MKREKYNKLTEEQKAKERKGCLERYYKNREKLIEKNKEWKKNNKEKITLTRFAYNIKNCYGITIDIYNTMFNNQNGCCAICNKHQSKFKNRLSVDHCHETGIVRDLLCNKCNLALGNFKDDIRLLENAIRYLKKHKTTNIISESESKIILGK